MAFMNNNKSNSSNLSYETNFDTFKRQKRNFLNVIWSMEREEVFST